MRPRRPPLAPAACLFPATLSSARGVIDVDIVPGGREPVWRAGTGGAPAPADPAVGSGDPWMEEG